MAELRVNRYLGVWAMLVAGAIAGCGGDDGGKIKPPPMGNVKGTIKLDDKPLANAVVEFIPATARGSSGKTDSNGVYTLMYDQATKGAAVGEHTVKIMGRTEAGTPEPVPAKFNERSELKATVKAGDNTFDFALKSK